MAKNRAQQINSTPLTEDIPPWEEDAATEEAPDDDAELWEVVERLWIPDAPTLDVFRQCLYKAPEFVIKRNALDGSFHIQHVRSGCVMHYAAGGACAWQYPEDVSSHSKGG